jgi:glycosyltransferase involved in cell wall biosynthesis
MRKPIICQLSDFGPEYPGSFVDSLLCLAEYCRKAMQLETLCVFPERAKERKWLQRFDGEGVQYAFLPAKRNIISPLRNLLKDFNPLIFHSHFQTFDLGAMFLKLTTYKNAKVVWHLHSIAQLSWRQRIKDALKIRLLARHCGDLFIPVGDGAYRNAIDRGFPREKLFLNHNGIDIARFSEGGDRQHRHVHSSPVGSNGRKVFLLLGYNPLIKGVDLFIKAAEKVFRDGLHRGLFVVVGRQTTKEFVSRLAESQQLGRALKILDPTDNFPALLGDIDVLVASSRSEGFGYAVIEAMAAGKLVLCSDIPGVRDAYGKSDGVWLFPTEDWKQLAELMQKAASLSSAEREYLGQVNSRYASVHYSLDAWGKKMGQVYTRLLNDEPNNGLITSQASSGGS